jgi:uncharacterized protein (TIGR04255 family)
MRIKSSDRVRYTKNPLQDVTGQVRFPPLLGLDDSLASKMQAALAKDFPIVQTGEPLQVAIAIGNKPTMAAPPSGKAPLIYQFLSLDQQERVALARDSVTFTQTKYERWETFREKLERVLELTAEIYQPSTVMRVGLRYRDLIDRDVLSINDASWRDLLAPFVLGGLGTVDLFEDGDLEQHLKGTLTISDVELDGYSLQLRHGLVTKQPGNRQCFLIDGDYYASDARAFVVSDIVGVFERLHAGAGSVFRRCISDRLHDALEPVATTSE